MMIFWCWTPSWTYFTYAWFIVNNAMSVNTAIVPGKAEWSIYMAKTGIPARRDETKNVPPPYKQHAIKTIETYTCRDPGHRPFPVNVPSRLSYKLAPSRVSYQQCMGHNNHDYNVRHKNGVYKYIPFSGTERHRNSFIPRAMRLEWLGT